MTERAFHANDEGLDDLDVALARSRSLGKVFARGSLCESRTDISGAAIEAVIAADFIDGLKKRCREVSQAEEKLLAQLFLAGTGENCISILPADDHPSAPLRVWQPFYELEMDAAQTYVCRFFGKTEFRPVSRFPPLHPDDHVVLIGSQVSNLGARILLGKADQEEPEFRIAHEGWRTELHWNLCTPSNAPQIEILDFRGLRKSSGHIIVERGNRVCYESKRDSAGTRYLDDYLLVTSLPRGKGGGQRALIFSGLHGAGTRAVELILREPPSGLLAEAARRIAGASCFQMLLHVDTAPDRRGESLPIDAEIVDARALVIE